MKAKIILLVFGIVISVDCFSQHHDAMSNFQRMLEFAEEKQWEINAALDRVEQIETLREQLVALQETKKNVEMSYQMAKRAEDDMKVLGSVADGGIHSLANAFEVILGQSINPADYIPKVPGTQNLRNAFEYDAASYLSDNTRSAHKELFTFNADDETNEDGNSLTKNLRAFGESSAAVFGMSQAWEKYAEEVKARNILKKKAQAEELRTQAKALQVEIETPELMNLTAADRMNFMNLVTEMYDKANRLDMEVVEEVKAEIEKQLPSNYELVLLIEEGVSIKLQNTLKQVVKPYVSNQKFSLSKYEKSYSRGKINQELQRGLEGL